MQNKNPGRFLKVAAFTLGLGIMVAGTFANEKNAGTVASFDANLNAASATAIDSAIPNKIGVCEQTATAQANQKIIASAANLDTILTGATELESKFIEPIQTAIAAQRLEMQIIEPGKRYEFLVKDGQTAFWKCVLSNNALLGDVADTNLASAFLSQADIFAKEIKKIGYAIGSAKEVDQFLNFVNTPDGEPVLETTILNSSGAVFFKVFETELPNFEKYNDLRQALRDRVGVTNLRPAVFGAESYYWMWGENDKMAASVFTAGGKVFGVSYQTAHFKSIRRAIDILQADFDLLEKKVELVKKSNGRFKDLTIGEFEKLTEDDLGPDLVRKLKALDTPKVDANSLKVDLLESEPAALMQTEPAAAAAEPVEESPLAKFEKAQATDPAPLPIPAEAGQVLENTTAPIPASL
ncbi:MAG: hypothetical protein V1936_04310 [Patescibacteria group bacterium]